VKPALKRVLWIVAGAGAIYFAVQGGEFGTSDLLRQRSEKRRLTASIDSLKLEIDSLRRLKRAVEADPRMQERIAREQFGMVRSNEILYLFDTLPDTGEARP
jgi:cell division protein FtsB